MSRDTRSTAPDPAPRRALVRPAPNPEPGLDYLVFLNAPLSSGARVDVCYVPDRDILTPESLEDYLTAVTDAEPSGAEATAALILGDLLNELLPRWLRATVTPPERAGITHKVVMEDRRPGWDNPALLARLAPL